MDLVCSLGSSSELDLYEKPSQSVAAKAFKKRRKIC